MKKFTLVLITMLIMFVLTGCGKKADTPQAVMEELLDLFDTYFTNMEKVDDVDGAIAAMENFAVKMQELKPRMEALEKEHPELKTMFKGGNVPDEFKKYEERFKEIMPKMMTLSTKMMQYMQDPKFQEAMKKFQDVMK